MKTKVPKKKIKTKMADTKTELFPASVNANLNVEPLKRSDSNESSTSSWDLLNNVSGFIIRSFKRFDFVAK